MNYYPTNPGLGGLGVPLPDLRGKWQPNIYDEEQKKEAEEDCYE